MSLKGYTIRSGRGETPQQYDEEVRNTYAMKLDVRSNVKL